MKTNKDSNDALKAFVKAPKGSSMEYGMDSASGLLAVQRYLPQLPFPGDYGVIPRTHCDDGQPIDCIIISPSPGYPGTMVEIKIIGAVRIQDGTVLDDKLVCVPVKDPKYDKLNDIKDLPSNTQKDIVRFFEGLKALDSDDAMVKSVEGSEKATEIFQRSKELYNRIIKGD